MPVQIQFIVKSMLLWSTENWRSPPCHTEQTSSFRPPPPFYFPASFTLSPSSISSIHLSLSSSSAFSKLSVLHLFSPVFHRTENLYTPVTFYKSASKYDLWPPSVLFFPRSSFFPSVNALFPTAVGIHFQANSHQQMQWKCNWKIFLWDTVA